jgi:hypothetical protein
LDKLGATCFYKRGEADDATSLELVVEPWVEGCPAAIKKQIEEISHMSSEKIDPILKPQAVSLIKDDDDKVEMVV